MDGRRGLEKMKEINKMKEIEISYCAGLFDGEGCVTIMWPKRQTYCLEINMTHKPTLERFAKCLGGTVTKHYNKRIEQKQQYRVRFFGKEAVRVGQLIMPYMTEKQMQISMLIGYSETKCQVQRKFYKEKLTEYKRMAF